MSFYAYQVAPIDFGWHFSKTVQETLKDFIGYDERSGTPSPDNVNHNGLTEFLAAWTAAQDEAGRAGWDGDFSVEPRVFWLPYEDGFEYGFAFKQNSNGATFILSPLPMPWFDNKRRSEEGRKALVGAAQNADKVLKTFISVEFEHIPDSEKTLWATALLLHADLCRQVVFLEESERGLPKLLTMADLASKMYEAKLWYFNKGNKSLLEISATKVCGKQLLSQRLNELKKTYQISYIDKFGTYRNTMSFHYDSNMPKNVMEFGNLDSDDFHGALIEFVRFSLDWSVLAQAVIKGSPTLPAASKK